MCYLASGLLVVIGSESGRALVVYNEDGQETEHHLSQVHGKMEAYVVCVQTTQTAVCI